MIDSDSDDEVMDPITMRNPKGSKSLSLQFEIPESVQAVINKIEQSQMIRAQEVSSQSIYRLCTALYNRVKKNTFVVV